MFGHKVSVPQDLCQGYDIGLREPQETRVTVDFLDPLTMNSSQYIY